MNFLYNCMISIVTTIVQTTAVTIRSVNLCFHESGGYLHNNQTPGWINNKMWRYILISDSPMTFAFRRASVPPTHPDNLRTKKHQNEVPRTQMDRIKPEARYKMENMTSCFGESSAHPTRLVERFATYIWGSWRRLDVWYQPKTYFSVMCKVTRRCF